MTFFNIFHQIGGEGNRTYIRNTPAPESSLVRYNDMKREVPASFYYLLIKLPDQIVSIDGSSQVGRSFVVAEQASFPDKIRYYDKK